MNSSVSVTQWLNKNNVKGFLASDEGEALFELAVEVCHLGPCLEIGSYCGKSTIYLAAACNLMDGVVYAVDHHQGSEEHQIGEEYHDADLFDNARHCINSYPYFLKNIQLAMVDHCVIPVLAESKKVAKYWDTPLSLVFVDGGHSPEMAMNDCLNWSDKICDGGFIAIHDIFEKPDEGGQGPYLGLQAILKKEGFHLVKKVNSMAIVSRTI